MGDGAVEVLLLHLDDFPLGSFDELAFIAEDDRAFETEAQVGVVNELLDALLLQEAVHVREIFRQMCIENDAPDGGLNELPLHLDGNGVRDVLIVIGRGEVDDFTGVAQTNRGKQLDFAGFQRENNFIGGTENTALALGAGFGLGQVVDAKDHVLRRHGERQAVRRRQDVARAEHQHRCFHLRFRRQRDVHGHLVAVKVGVERGADQRVNADGFAFDEHRLERLNAEAVQRRRAVQQHGMFANDILENVPDHRLLLLDHFLGLLDGGAVTLGFELVIDEGLKEFEGHFLRQTALVELELRADDDDGTAGVVYALAEQVLAEAALLALERVGQRFERAAVVEQRVHGFLQHALFVAYDDVGRTKLHELLQAVVAVDDATIEVVEIGGREAAAIQRH